jgi:hypothetical protein
MLRAGMCEDDSIEQVRLRGAAKARSYYVQ